MSDLIQIERERFVDIVRYNVVLWSTFAIDDSSISCMQYIDDRDGCVQAQAIYPAPLHRGEPVIPIYETRPEHFEASVMRELPDHESE